MEKFTKGPWKAIEKQASWNVDMTENKSISIIPHISMTDEERRANAALIAAAPDMYEALKAFLDSYDCGYLDLVDLPEDIVNKIRAALAKADGR